LVLTHQRQQYQITVCMKEYDVKRVGLRMKKLRIERGHRQQLLAATIGMTQAGYSKLENGECALSIERAMALARFYKITLTELLD
jgi:transcriptional regulator with XRE-family HTH domain